MSGVSSQDKGALDADIIVVGAGITGLAAAHRLINQTANATSATRVIVLESKGKAGGVIETIEQEGCLMETGPDSILASKTSGLNLALELGLCQRIVKTNEENRRAFIAYKGALHPIPEGFELIAPTRFAPFLRWEILSWTGKLRMLGELFIPKSRRSKNDKWDESLSSFVRRRFGEEALFRIAQPMIGGIYTADPETLSLRATMPRFLDLEDAHGSVIRGMIAQKRKSKSSNQADSSKVAGARYSAFVSFDRGIGVLVDSLIASMPKDILKFDAQVDEIRREQNDDSYLVRLKSQEELKAKSVILAVPAREAGALLGSIHDSLGGQISAIQSASSAVLNFVFKRSDISHKLDGFGFVVPQSERRSSIAASFATVKYPGRAPEGHCVIRVFMGGALNEEIFKHDDGKLIELALNDLRHYLGVAAKPLKTIVTRWPHSMPQYKVGHVHYVECIEEKLSKELPGVFLAGSSYHGVGIPDCIASGETAAGKAIDWLQSSVS